MRKLQFAVEIPPLQAQIGERFRKGQYNLNEIEQKEAVVVPSDQCQNLTIFSLFTGVIALYVVYFLFHFSFPDTKK